MLITSHVLLTARHPGTHPPTPVPSSKPSELTVSCGLSLSLMTARSIVPPFPWGPLRWFLCSTSVKPRDRRLLRRAYSAQRNALQSRPCRGIGRVFELTFVWCEVGVQSKSFASFVGKTISPLDVLACTSQSVDHRVWAYLWVPAFQSTSRIHPWSPRPRRIHQMPTAV